MSLKSVCDNKKSNKEHLRKKKLKKQKNTFESQGNS